MQSLLLWGAEQMVTCCRVWGADDDFSVREGEVYAVSSLQPKASWDRCAERQPCRDSVLRFEQREGLEG